MCGFFNARCIILWGPCRITKMGGLLPFVMWKRSDRMVPRNDWNPTLYLYMYMHGNDEQVVFSMDVNFLILLKL